MIPNIRKPHSLEPGLLGTDDIGLRVVAHIENPMPSHPELLDESTIDQRMWFAVAQLAGYEHDIKERGETYLVNDLSGRRPVGEIRK